MNQRIKSISSRSEPLIIPFKWRVENFGVLAEDWADIVSPNFDVFPKCCSLSFKIGRSNTSDVYYFSIIYNTGIDKLNSRQHLKTSHDVLSGFFHQYLLGGDGHAKHPQEWGDGLLLTPNTFQEIKESELNKVLNNGSLELRMNLELTRLVHQNQDIVVPESIETLNDVTQLLESLLEVGLFSDFQIRANGKTLKVHKNILAIRSPYFLGMFGNGMKESEESVLNLDTVDPFVVEKLVRFIYTNKLEFTNDEVKDSELAIELLKLADRYQLLQLKPPCEINLIDKFSTDNIVEMLTLADTYKALNLRKGAIEFIRLNKSSLVTHDDFQELVARSPQLGADILDTLFKIKV